MPARLARAATAAALASLFATVTVGVAHAGGTRSFRLTSYKDFDEGEAHGVLVSSLGEVTSGLGPTRIDIPEAAVWSSLVAADGTVYFGTGDQGAVWAYKKGKAQKLAQLDGVLVTTLAQGPGGKLFAGVMPGGRIYLVDPKQADKPRELARLDAEHVWSLSYDEGRQTLYAATGPKGQLWAIDVKGLDRPYVGQRARVLVETGEKHLLSMARADDGSLYLGSSDQALLFRVTPESVGARLTAVHDFEGDEVRAIARRGSTLYVAVNEFTRTSTSSTTTANAPKGTKMVVPSSSTASTSGTGARDRKGKGAVWRIDGDGRVEQLHALADGYFTALSVDADGNVFAASGSNGKVYLIRPDRTVVTALDLPERQVLTLAFDPSAAGERLLGTGDAGALYRVSDAPPKDAAYTTKVLDAGFPSHFGAVRWSGTGDLAVQTRSGNTARPDKTWSPWTGLAKLERRPDGEGGEGKTASPPGRYVQVRVAFNGPRATLRDLTLYHQLQNQRPRVTEVQVGDDGRRPAVKSGKPRSPVVKVKWKVENPDDDELVYRLWFREEGESNWKPLGGPDPLTRTDYEWNTESIPDGNYLVKVVASDERANPREEALEHALMSAPFLVDNKKPELVDVRIDKGVVVGRARDGFSPLADLSYSVDGGDWQPIAPKDGVLDDLTEEFTFKLPPGLATGSHSVAVRAVDGADNVGAMQLPFRVGAPAATRSAAR